MKAFLIHVSVFIYSASSFLFAHDDWEISAQIQLRSELDGRD